jgi:hypothetical protein
MSARVTRPCVSLASRNPEYRSSSDRLIRVADAVPVGIGPTTSPLLEPNLWWNVTGSF